MDLSNLMFSRIDRENGVLVEHIVRCVSKRDGAGLTICHHARERSRNLSLKTGFKSGSIRGNTTLPFDAVVRGVAARHHRQRHSQIGQLAERLEYPSRQRSQNVIAQVPSEPMRNTRHAEGVGLEQHRSVDATQVRIGMLTR